MVRPSLRSKSMRKVSKKVPGGGGRVFYIRGKHYRVSDPVTGELINGVPVNPKWIRKGAKTRKKPERIFGGVLSPNTLATALKAVIRSIE